MSLLHARSASCSVSGPDLLIIMMQGSVKAHRCRSPECWHHRPKKSDQATARGRFKGHAWSFALKRDVLQHACTHFCLSQLAVSKWCGVCYNLKCLHTLAKFQLIRAVGELWSYHVMQILSGSMHAYLGRHFACNLTTSTGHGCQAFWSTTISSWCQHEPVLMRFKMPCCSGMEVLGQDNAMLL